MRRRIALEHYTKSDMIGVRNWVFFHAFDQIPYEIEFEKLAQNVNHTIIGISGVIEAALDLDPIEELERAFPIIGVAREGLAHIGMIKTG